ncbi:hypothetical protein [Sphingobacterium sp. E70]|uniref:hypothetical protein n=1 Tax=Sphingobacterium sp. E70 TaxID=2853439 RepID=UPI0027954FC3|nr:hypothetical protein [Sphingobacterium sp. E70]
MEKDRPHWILGECSLRRSSRRNFILYYLQPLFEYNYAFAHSSRDLPTYYIISSFWEGQEGSFWLWMFWQTVLGAILLFKAKSWETSVMTFVMLCQAFLASMIIGVELLGLRIEAPHSSSYVMRWISLY